MKTLSIFVCSTLAFLTGCSSTTKTIRVVAEGSMAQASIQVDVAEHSPELEGVSVSEYFKPGNGVRASANKRTLIFGGGRATQQELAAEGLGKKAVVIAYLPGARVDAAGDADSRRKNLPLRGKMSDGRKVSNVMKVSVGDAGVTVAPDGK